MPDKKFFVSGAEKILPTVNDTPYKRIIAVGDVHGKFKKFLSLWEKISVAEDSLVVFLGDYVDRGEGVAEMLAWVMNHRYKKNFVFLRGNHEQMLINAFKESREVLDKIFSGEKNRLTYSDLAEHDALYLSVMNGGDKTLSALVKLQDEKIFTVDEILNCLESLPLSYRIKIGDRDYFFCHAGVDGKVPLDAQDEEFLLWSREKFFDVYDGDAVIISGHSPVQAFPKFGVADAPRPIKLPDRNVLMVDTGGFVRGGKISAVDILTGEYWQSDTPTPKLLFVCAGNTCRSPMAKYVMRHLLNEVGLAEKLFVDSAGCQTYGGGHLSKKAREVLSEKNIPFDEHVSKTFTPKLYKDFQFIITLDSNVFEQAVKISGGDPDKKIFMFTDDGKEIDIADPYPDGDYRKTCEDIIHCCATFLKELIGR